MIEFDKQEKDVLIHYLSGQKKWLFHVKKEYPAVFQEKYDIISSILEKINPIGPKEHPLKTKLKI